MQSLIIFIASLAVTVRQLDGCKQTADSRKDSITAVNLFYHMPIIQPDGSKIDYNNTYNIYYNGDLNMYRFNYKLDSGGDVSELIETRYFYVTHHKDSVYGYLFDPSKIYPQIRFKVDSLRSLRHENLGWDSIAIINPDSSFSTEQGDLINIYNLPATPAYGGSFTYYFYYTERLLAIRESFSKTLEEKYKRKLYRIRMVIHPTYYEPFKRMVPLMEAYYLMKLTTVEKREEVMRYFNKYKQLTCIK